MEQRQTTEPELVRAILFFESFFFARSGVDI
jgi:hypothetical protein